MGGQKETNLVLLQRAWILFVKRDNALGEQAGTEFVDSSSSSYKYGIARKISDYRLNAYNRNLCCDVSIVWTAGNCDRYDRGVSGNGCSGRECPIDGCWRLCCHHPNHVRNDCVFVGYGGNDLFDKENRYRVKAVRR